MLPGHARDISFGGLCVKTGFSGFWAQGPAHGAGPMGRAHGAGAGAGALLVKATSQANLHPEKITCPGPNLGQFW